MDKFMTRGKYSYGEPEVIRFDGNKSYIRIGKFCAIAKGCKIILNGNHRMHWVSTFPFPKQAVRVPLFKKARRINCNGMSKGDVIIGNDVWVGLDVTILSGVTIGHGACIAAKSVVTKDVPPYTLVAGVPAKEIRKRFSESQIKSLLEIAWWNWSDKKLARYVDMLCCDDIDGFIKTVKG